MSEPPSGSDGKTRRQSGSRRQRRAAKTMPKWKAWLLIGALLSLTGLLLWFGLAIVVRCDRAPEGRVDVTVERRFLGLLALSTETVPDVVKADVYIVWTRSGGGGKQRHGSTVALELTPRHGPVCRRSRIGPSFGTDPYDMVEQIERFLNEPSERSLTSWWMPWLVNVAAVPFVLIVGGILGEVLLRALGFLKPVPLPTQADP